jgi:hypothetical protein
MHVVFVLAFLVVAGLLSLLVKRDPNKWYGDMLCLSCNYRWVARKRTPPARCPGCGRRYLHVVTGSNPRPIAPSVSQISHEHQAHEHQAYVAVPTAQEVSIGIKGQLDRHRRLEKLLANPGIAVSQKAFYVVALTRNADAVNLMHRLKVSEVEADALLQQLELSKFVSSPDETGDRVVLVEIEE